ncbi:glycoside hydrolase family protein [Ancylobacter oerskovii]|nr:peptidoglycan-binding protein [Ancylobacter oerskovii]
MRRPIDGVMGLKTRAATIAFQRAAGLYPHGIAGPKTEAALKAAIEARAVDVTPAPVRQSMSAIGLAVLISREARKLTAYRDTKGILDNRHQPYRRRRRADPLSGAHDHRGRGGRHLCPDLTQYEDAVRAAVKVGLADHQYDALVSVCYNIGTGAFAGATFVKRINAGESRARIRAAILMWCKPTEILSRRTGEADQFVTPYSVSLPKARSTDARPISVAA